MRKKRGANEQLYGNYAAKMKANENVYLLYLYVITDAEERNADHRDSKAPAETPLALNRGREERQWVAIGNWTPVKMKETLYYYYIYTIDLKGCVWIVAWNCSVWLFQGVLLEH